MVLFDRLRLAALLLAAACSASALPPSELAAAAAPPAPKYFQEPGGSLARMHYDARFFHGEVAYNERQGVLRDLIRGYLETTRARGVETWLAHGTLLGWWWNARVMPWDYDLDVQVTNGTMAWLADRFNDTRHDVTFADAASAQPNGGPERTRTYLLDINPHWADLRSRGGSNIIDGRWIDVDNGMFVDITVVRERSPQREPGVWSCKNDHQYSAQDLWPLRATEFEGVPAWIPYSFEKILADEYSPGSMSKELHQYHQWDHDLKQWVMDDPEQRDRAKAAAAAYKKQQLGYQGRL